MKKEMIHIQLTGEYNETIDTFDENGLTQLHKAIVKSDTNKMIELIKQGADINIREKYNYSPIEYACMYNKIEEAKILLENGVNIKNRDLLQITCINGYIEMEKLLIKFGCDVDEIDIYDRTPAYWAIQENNLECLKILYKNGANFEVRSYKNSTLLSYAVGEGNIEIVKYLLDIGLKKYINDIIQPPLLLAVHWKYVNIIKLLLENGADVNLRDREGNIPLIDSVTNGNYEITRLLLQYGADMNITNKDEKNAMELLNIKFKQIQELLKMISR